MSIKSTAPFLLSNSQISSNLFASDALVDASFEGLQRNNDRSLVEFYFTSMFLNSTEFRTNLVRIKDGVNTNLTISKPFGDIVFTEGYANIEFDTGLSTIGLTKIKFKVSETQSNLSSGLSLEQTKFDSRYIFGEELDLDFQDKIISIPTEIMDSLDDVSGINLKNHIKRISITSKFNELPKDNKVRLNYLSVNKSNNTCYGSFYIYTQDDVLIRAIEGSSLMTFSVSDFSNVYQDITIDGYRLIWNADFSQFSENLLLSGLTFSNAGFKYPACSIDRSFNIFNTSFNTLGNTVNKRNFDISRFIKKIEISNVSKDFLVQSGSAKSLRINYIEVSDTENYVSFNFGGQEFSGQRPVKNTGNGLQKVDFIYSTITLSVYAYWNEVSNYNFNYSNLSNNSATLDDSVILNSYVLIDATGLDNKLTFNDKFRNALSTNKVLPYLWNSLNWGQSSKIPKTNFVSLTDHNDEPNAMVSVLNWIDSDTAIKKSIPCALMQGDFVTALQTNVSSFSQKFNDWFSLIPNNTPILWCNGNHDLGLDGNPLLIDVPTKSIRKGLIFDQLYDRLPQNYKDNFVTGSNVDDMYYYCDVPNTNVRVIALDQFEYPLVAGNGRNIKYSGTAIRDNSGTIVAGFNVYYTQQQLEFVKNALETMPESSTAIIMVHIPIDSGSDSNGELNALGNSNEALRDIIDSYRNFTNTSVQVNSIDEESSFVVSTNFSTRSESRCLIINGHLHEYKSSILTSAGSTNVIQCQAIGNTSPYASIDGDSISSYGADILSINEDKNELSILRYGTRRTIGSSGIFLNNNIDGFDFIDKPLKL